MVSTSCIDPLRHKHRVCVLLLIAVSFFIGATAEIGFSNETSSPTTEDSSVELSINKTGEDVQTWDTLTYMYKETKERLARLYSNDKKLIFVHCAYGLANRLRALASAAVNAEVSGRQLIIIWVPDIHSDVRFTDLFEDPSAIVLHEFHIGMLRGKNFTVDQYDYLDEKRKNVRIRLESPHHVYVRSAFTLRTSYAIADDELNRKLKEFEMIKPLRVQTSYYLERFRRTRVMGNVVGVHIRMRSELEKDVPGVDLSLKGISKGLTRTLAKRRQCHYQFFIPKMRNLLEKEPYTRFLVTTDTPEIIRSLEEEFGSSRILHSSMDMLSRCSGALARKIGCQRFALLELVLLSRSSRLLVSEYSSFSEIMIRLSNLTGDKVESGCLKQEGIDTIGVLYVVSVTGIIFIFYMVSTFRSNASESQSPISSSVLQ